MSSSNNTNTNNFIAQFPNTGWAVGALDSAGVNMQPLNLDVLGNLKVSVTGAGSGGTSSNFNAAFPVAGTAAGALDSTGTNMVPLNLDVSGNLKVAGTFSAAANATTNVTQWAGTAVDVNSGNKSAGTLRVTIATDQVQLTNALKVDGSAVTQPISAAALPLPTGASTAAAQATGNASLSSIDGKITAVNTGAVVVASSALPAGASTAAKQPALGTAGTASADVISIQGIASMTPLAVTGTFFQATQPVSGTVTTTPPANASTNLTQIVGTAADVNSGNKSAGTLRVTLATDQVQLTNALKVDGSAVTQPISAVSLPLPTGASTAAKQPALGTAGTASADVLSIQGIASMTPLAVTGTFFQATQPVSGTVTTTPPANASTNLTQIVGTAADVNSGNKSAGTLRVVLATDQPALTNKLLVTPDSVALPANQSVNVSQINAVTPLMGNGVTGTGSQRVTIASDNTAFQVIDTGAAAHGAAISGNPVRLAGRALTADYAALTAGQTADLVTTLLGKLVTIPYANPANTWSSAAASGGIVNTTGTTAKAAGAAGVRNYITHVSVINGHATVSTDVQIRDGASGTVLWRGFAQAGGGGVSESFDPPLRGSTATLVEIANGTTGSATYFNLQGFTAAE